MGHGYKRFQTQASHNNQKATIFLPMLCSKQSVKDVKQLYHHPKCKSDRLSPSSTSSSSSFSTIDPLSPAIGCMGQVKRNNRVLLTFPTTTTTSHNRSNNDVHSHVKYHKLRKLFSGKNLTVTPAATAAAATGCGNRRPQGRRSMCSNNMKVGNENYSSKCNNNNNNNNLTSVVDLDPPLPVIKKVISGNGGDNDKAAECLWKRRFNNNNGVRLQSLQIEQISLRPRHQLQLITV